MKKKLGIAVIGLLVGVVALGLLLNATFNPKPRVIANEKAAFQVPADELQYFFANNEETASQKYMDKVLEVLGEVTEIDGKSIVLEQGVQCLVSKEENLRKHQPDQPAHQATNHGFGGIGDIRHGLSNLGRSILALKELL